MFKKFFGKDEKPARTLTSPEQLQVGDLITLKPRSTLPDCLQGETLEVTKISTYEFPSGYEPEFTVKTSTGRTLSMSLSDDGGDIEMSFSIEISRNTVIALFGEAEFSRLWEDDFAELKTNLDAADEELAGWLAPNYWQTEKMAEAYFYKKDMRGKGNNQYVSHDSEELRYHFCAGGEEEEFGLSVEIWEGGETDVYVSKSFAVNVIEEMWPNARPNTR